MTPTVEVPATDTTVDPRPRHRRMREPVAWIATVALGTLTLALLDPHTPGRYPLCPTQAVLGIDCPGCGGLRATHDLAHGRVAEAFGHNALLVIAAPIVVLVLLRGVWLAWRGRTPGRLSARTFRWVLIAVTLVLVGFSVFRNLPAGSFLAS